MLVKKSKLPRRKKTTPSKKNVTDFEPYDWCLLGMGGNKKESAVTLNKQVQEIDEKIFSKPYHHIWEK